MTRKEEIELSMEVPNYMPCWKIKKSWKQRIQGIFFDAIFAICDELQSFWSFFWRWLLGYTPIWLLLMWAWCTVSSSP